MSQTCAGPSDTIMRSLPVTRGAFENNFLAWLKEIMFLRIAPEVKQIHSANWISLPSGVTKLRSPVSGKRILCRRRSALRASVSQKSRTGDQRHCVELLLGDFRGEHSFKLKSRKTTSEDTRMRSGSAVISTQGCPSVASSSCTLPALPLSLSARMENFGF